MKPPARSTRSTKSVVECVEKKPLLKTKLNKDSHVKGKWSSRELRTIAAGVRQQFKSCLDDIDTRALQTRVPKRSIQEVESLLEPLKLTVARKVFHQAKKQLKNEREQRVPIQVWTELMARMAGNHEENISSAFSRMLVIAGTEPCSLQHSDPPRPLKTPSSALTSVQTISGFSTSGTVNGSKSGAQIGSTGDAQRLSRMECVSNPNISCPDKNNSLLSKPSLSSSTPATAVVSETYTSAIPSPSVSRQPSSSPVGVSSLSSSLSLHSQRSGDDQGAKSSQGNPSQSDGLENTVDFEKIYTYLSTVRKGGHERHLTPMECAVVVDLIMSLPEEIPLLDCDNLQEHFLQMYARLATPFNPPLTNIVAEPTNLGEETSSRLAAEPTNLGEETSSRLTAEPTNLGEETSSRLAAELTNLGEETSSRLAAEPTNLGEETSSRLAAEPTNLGEEISSRLVAEPTNLGGETSSGIQSEESTAVPQAPQVKENWENIGICPLNPLMVPVSLLARKQDTNQ